MGCSDPHQCSRADSRLLRGISTGRGRLEQVKKLKLRMPIALPRSQLRAFSRLPLCFPRLGLVSLVEPRCSGLFAVLTWTPSSHVVYEMTTCQQRMAWVD